MAESAVEICNDALAILRANPIASLTEDSENARRCNRFYSRGLRACLRMHPWNFAMARQQLAQNATAPAFEYDHAYTLPTDPYCLKVMGLWTGSQWIRRFKIEGRNIVTELDECWIKYTALVTDTLQFDALFDEALAVWIAWKLSTPTTGSKTRADQMEARFDWIMRHAKKQDGIEDWREGVMTSPFVTERNS